jgi:hypothetical protein
MFNIEGLEMLLNALALISAARSAYLWHRAASVRDLSDQPSGTLSGRSRLHMEAAGAAAFAVFFLFLLMMCHAVEALSGAAPPTVAWPPQSN